ncbi:dihydropteroate synthase [Campylobacter sp. faydin G-140]|uniref:dihydropteroate synthase n=1 Tax=Campylobacter anatolicus TaxID=2829105 RepID=UPI001B94BBDA|nr:dihydropteroate synthase [Campylobacter anatolicus]MBR8462853.1 dihydropteroate synthase [Campylobacter anatolicus]MBR8465875.1 dihydropteroate synthase [Campylobacter anatolicus]
MKFYKINKDSDFNAICECIKPSMAGANLMAKKSCINFIFIDNISSPAANILKQDALSVGAELVTHNDTILAHDLCSNALLMGTDAQLEALAKKEKVQDFGLKNLANFLSKNFKKPTKPQIMGVVNINEDSFNAKSRINNSNGIKRIEAMIEQGASYIDLGGVSSRPGSVYCGREEEFRRIKDIVDEIYRLNLHQKAKFSLDSFDEYCLEYVLNHGFAMINDITANTNLAILAARYDAEFCMMHMQGDPQNMQNAPHYDDLIGEMDEFFDQKIQQVTALGAKKLVLDVGIGFGKTAKHNMLLIKHLEHFLHFGYPLLVGASRKSVINFYAPSEVSERLPGSLYLHLKSFENGAKIIRTHDVSEHAQMFALDCAMRDTNLW